MKKVGRYEILAELGRGPLGVVYRAHDPQKGREVRLKTILSPRVSVEGARLFSQAAKRSGTLKHEGIAKIFAVGEVAGKPFATGEPVDETLADVIERREQLSLRRRIHLTRAVAGALAAAHSQGVVHTGLKAANVGLVDGKVKLLDFGSGLALDAASAADTTRSLTVLDGVRYLAPEVLEGSPADDQSDVYAVGVLLYEILTFEKPFAATSVAAIIKKIINQQIRALTQIDPSFPPSLDAILARTLARRAAGRYKSILDLAHDLERVEQSLPAVRESTRPIPVAVPSHAEARSLEPLARSLAEKILEARRLYDAGDKDACQKLMRQVEGYTSRDDQYPGLAEMVRLKVDEVAHTMAPSPLTPRGSPTDLYAQAHSLYTAGDYAACLAMLQDLFSETPDHQQGRMLAMSAERALRSTAAVAEEDGSQSRAQASALLHVGRTALSRGDLQAAETVQRALQGISPDGPELKEIRASLSEARLAALRALPAEVPGIPSARRAAEASKEQSKSSELRARLKQWLAQAAEKLEADAPLEALTLAFEVVKVDPSRLEALVLMEKCIAQMKTRARERTLVSIEVEPPQRGRKKKD